MQYIRVLAQQAYEWLMQFVLVQLFINLLTWPIFLGWGLPITPLSIVGNLIFSPFLTAFLSLSCIIVMCELLYVPHGMLVNVLEMTTSFWLYLTKQPMPNCMITCVTPPLLLSLIAPLAATGIIVNRTLRKKEEKVAALLATYVLLIVFFWCLPTPSEITVPYGNHQITIIKQKDKLVLIDPGFGRRKSGIYQWITYTLLPAMGSQLGTQRLDKVILKHKTPSSVECAQMVQKYTGAKELIINEF